MDEVRMWMVDTENKKRRATGQVTDLRNGSYKLETTCLWAGSVAKVTVCHPTANVPGRPCVCNFTSFNSREYYCGKPLDERLDCCDWNATYPINYALPYRLTEAEKQLIDEMPTTALSRTVEPDILIRTSKKGHLLEVPNCHEVSPRVTWDMTSRPQGFWDVDGVWRSLRCQNMKFPGESFVECLKNSQIYVFGDSNSNRMYGYLVGRTFSKPTYPGAWPYKAEAVNKEWDIKLKFYPHEYPLFLGQKWEQIIQYGSVEKLIDGIPSTGRQLVIVHYYLHMSHFHMSVGRSRVEAAARAIARLLARNPEARVAFRGPHVSSHETVYNNSIGGDTLGKQFLEIISKAFARLKDQVIFLDGWEMTTALENLEYHPDDKVPNEMIMTFLSFLCR